MSSRERKSSALRCSNLIFCRKKKQIFSLQYLPCQSRMHVPAGTVGSSLFTQLTYEERSPL
jgi:hypothetical protein